MIKELNIEVWWPGNEATYASWSLHTQARLKPWSSRCTLSNAKRFIQKLFVVQKLWSKQWVYVTFLALFSKWFWEFLNCDYFRTIKITSITLCWYISNSSCVPKTKGYEPVQNMVSIAVITIVIVASTIVVVPIKKKKKTIIVGPSCCFGRLVCCFSNSSWSLNFIYLGCFLPLDLWICGFSIFFIIKIVDLWLHFLYLWRWFLRKKNEFFFFLRNKHTHT